MGDYYGLAGVLVVVALVQAIKPFVADNRLYPIIAVVLGVAWNVGLAYQMGQALGPAVPLGIVVGLAASGLYSAGSTVKNG